MSVRLSDLHEPDILASSPKGGVNALRDRFEKFGQGENTANANQNSASRSSSPLRPSTPPVRRTQGPPTPPVGRTQGPPRPPPPKPSEKPKRYSDIPSESVDREQARSPVKQPLPQRQQHPLTKSKSQSVGDLKVIKKDTEREADGASNGVITVEEVDTLHKKGKKEKKKSKSKDDLINGAGKSAKFWRVKSKSTDVKDSPKSSPEASSKRKVSAPTVSHHSPLSSAKKEPLASTSESSSPESGSTEGTPESGRRISGTGKKLAVKKTESSLVDAASRGSENVRPEKKRLKKSKSTSGMEIHSRGSEDSMVASGTTPQGSPVVGGRGRGRETGEEDVRKEAKRIRKAVLNAG